MDVAPSCLGGMGLDVVGLDGMGLDGLGWVLIIIHPKSGKNGGVFMLDLSND